MFDYYMKNLFLIYITSLSPNPEAFYIPYTPIIMTPETYYIFKGQVQQSKHNIYQKLCKREFTNLRSGTRSVTFYTFFPNISHIFLLSI